MRTNLSRVPFTFPVVPKVGPDGYGLPGKMHFLRSAIRTDERRPPVGEATDKIKGNVKETAGDLTGDDSMKREGKADKAGAEVKEKVGEVVDKVKDVLHKD
jgi:uncharacterized protein YjbJ (UPF0337 family)